MNNMLLLLGSIPTVFLPETAITSPSNLYTYLGIAIGTAAILFCIYQNIQISILRRKVLRFITEDKSRRDSNAFKQQFPRVENEFKGFELKKDVTTVEKTDFVTKSFLEKTFNGIDERLIALEDPKLAKKLFGDDLNPVVNGAEEGVFYSVTESTEDLTTSALEKEKVVKIFFAKLPDLEKGFNEADFLSVQNGEQIYELTLTDLEGTFIISSTIEAQIYALSDVNTYLTGACEFHTPPSRNSKIVTTSPGTLQKSGMHWLIIDKAKIDFV